MKKSITLLLICMLLFGSFSFSQQKKKVLFIGNSYTASNMLPQVVADIAYSMGDTLIYDSYTPGGYTFQQHSTDATTLSKIASGKWDFVVLQEQSQLPSFPQTQVQTDVYPFADSLNRRIKENDSCTTTLFYMTWGRKNGDAMNCGNWPPVCTYDGMQEQLRYSYLKMTHDLDAECCPAGITWWRCRIQQPTLELFSPDESHPSMAGTYLTAASFYSTIFRRSAVSSAYIPGGMNANDCSTLQQIAASVVFDSLGVWNIDTSSVHADFSWWASGPQFTFTNLSLHADQWLWDFGDGSFSTQEHPQHTYTQPGNTAVVLIAMRDCSSDTVKQFVNVITGLGNGNEAVLIKLWPNPASEMLLVESSPDFWGQTYRLSDLSGRVLLQGSLLQGKTALNVSDIKPGLYTFQAGSVSLKLLVFR